MRGDSAFRWAALGIAGVSIVVSAVPLNDVFFGQGHLLLVALSVMAASLVSLGLRAASVSGATEVFGHAAAMIFLFSVVMFRSEGLGIGAIAATWAGSTGGWVDLLRLDTPATPTSHVLMPLVLASWVAMTIVIALVLGPRPGSYGLVALALVMLGFLLLGVGETPKVELAVAQAALALLFVRLTIAQPPFVDTKSAASRVQPATSVAALGALAIGIGFVSASTIQNEDRVDPRRGLRPPTLASAAPSPLAKLKPQLRATQTPSLITVEHLGGAILPDELLVRTAALDFYDGVIWRSTVVFPRTGAQLRDDDDTYEDGLSDLRIVTTNAYDEQYLPVVGDPVSIDLAGAGFARETDTLILSGQASGRSYVLRTDLQAFSDAALRAGSADVGDGGLPIRIDDESERFLQTPDQTPTELLQLLDQLEGERGSVDRLLELRGLVTDDFLYSDVGPSGHSLASLALYAGAGSPTDASSYVDTVFPARTGDAEQAVSLFVVLARADGYPARVAVGYRQKPMLAGQNASADVAVSFSAADAWAWAEVKIHPFGWVPLDVTPTNPNEDAVPPVAPPVSAKSESTRQTASIALPVLDDTGGGSTTSSSSVLWRWFLGAAALGLFVVVPVGLKAFRRRRRLRGPDSATVVIGYWLEIRDRLRESGVAISPAFTPAETTRAAELVAVLEDSTVGRSAAGLCDQALYDSDSILPEQAGIMKSYESILAGELRGVGSRWRRAWMRVGPGSLLPMANDAAAPPSVFVDCPDMYRLRAKEAQ